MSNRQFIGNVHFSEQPQSIQFREGAGWRKVRTFTGAKALLPEFVLPDFACDVDVKLGPVQAEIQATYQLVDPTSFTWELVGNDHELSIWQHPKIAKIFDTLDNDARVGLVGILVTAKGQTPPVAPSALQLLVGPLTEQDEKDIREFYTRLIINQDTFLFSQYVLSKTILASSKSDQVDTEVEFKANHKEVTSIYSYDQLLQHEPTLSLGSSVSTSSIWTNLFSDTPIASGTFEISGVNLIKFSGLGPEGENLLWQKRTPKVQLLQRGMWQVSQEYWGAKNFDKWKYHYVGTPP